MLTPSDFQEFADWYAGRFSRRRGYAPSPNTLRRKVTGACGIANAMGCDSVEFFGRLLSDREVVLSALDKRCIDHSNGTVRGDVYAVLDFGEYAKAKGWTSHVALDKSDAPGPNPQAVIEVYTPEEVDQLLAAARGRGLRWWMFLVTIADTGRRVGEVLGLRWENLHDDYFDLPHTKNRRQQFVPLGKRLREEVYTPQNIGDLKAGVDSDARFTKSVLDYPYPWNYSAVHARFDRFCATMRVRNRGFHNFRHTKATNMLASGVPIQAVAALLGHANVATTDRIYNHATALNYREYVE
jgi:integrase